MRGSAEVLVHSVLLYHQKNKTAGVLKAYTGKLSFWPMLVEITLKVFEIFQVFDSLYQTQLFCHLVFPFCAQYPVKKTQFKEFSTLFTFVSSFTFSPSWPAPSTSHFKETF